MAESRSPCEGTSTTHWVCTQTFRNRHQLLRITAVLTEHRDQGQGFLLEVKWQQSNNGAWQQHDDGNVVQNSASWADLWEVTCVSFLYFFGTLSPWPPQERNFNFAVVHILGYEETHTCDAMKQHLCEVIFYTFYTAVGIKFCLHCDFSINLSRRKKNVLWAFWIRGNVLKHTWKYIGGFIMFFSSDFFQFADEPRRTLIETNLCVI